MSPHSQVTGDHFEQLIHHYRRAQCQITSCTCSGRSIASLLSRTLSPLRFSRVQGIARQRLSRPPSYAAPKGRSMTAHTRFTGGHRRKSLIRRVAKMEFVWYAYPYPGTYPGTFPNTSKTISGLSYARWRKG